MESAGQRWKPGFKNYGSEGWGSNPSERAEKVQFKGLVAGIVLMDVAPLTDYLKDNVAEQCVKIRFMLSAVVPAPG
jgi:hypothetical protein